MSIGGTNTGLGTYDAARWGSALPAQTHVVPTRHGLGFLQQTTREAPRGGAPLWFEASVPAHAQSFILLYWRRPARGLRMRLGRCWETVSLVPRDVIALPCGVDSDWAGDAACHDGVVHIHLDARGLASRASESGVGVPGEGQVRRQMRCARLDRLVDLVLAEVGPAGETTDLTWSSLACLMQLSALHLLGAALERRVEGLARWQERRCVEYLSANLAREVTLRELAGVVGLSPFHFARQFKRSVGVPPHAFQVRLRHERACELLHDPSLTVLDVAALVGYRSAQAFARAFRRESGVAPAVWRRLHVRRMSRA